MIYIKVNQGIDRVKGKTTMKDIRDILIDLANEFQNDYLTIDKMAEHKSIDSVALEAMIKEGQKLRRDRDYQNN